MRARWKNRPSGAFFVARRSGPCLGLENGESKIFYWLVVWNSFFPYIENVIIPTDSYFFRGVGITPTRHGLTTRKWDEVRIYVVPTRMAWSQPCLDVFKWDTDRYRYQQSEIGQPSMCQSWRSLPTKLRSGQLSTVWEFADIYWYHNILVIIYKYIIIYIISITLIYIFNFPEHVRSTGVYCRL